MPKPDSVSEEDLLRWDDNIDNDPLFPKSLASSPVIREVCYAGLWLVEQLAQLQCPDFVIVKLQDAAGRLSFGRDPWDVSQLLLQKYQDNELIFEEDVDSIKN